MTQTSEESSNGVFFPTKWHSVDITTGVECRQLTDDTYQIRSQRTIATITAEGFNLFRNASSDPEAWDKWIYDNNIEFVPRTDNV